jgi:Ca2+-binding RTX toxin-like protein
MKRENDMATLDTTELEQISDIDFDTYIALNNITGQNAAKRYYDTLAREAEEAGLENTKHYADLARAKLDNSTLRASFENDYAKKIAAEDGVDLTVNSTAFHRLQYEKMQEDIRIRLQEIASGKDGELNHQTLNRLDKLAHESINVSPGASISYVPLSQLSQHDPQAAAELFTRLYGPEGNAVTDSLGIAGFTNLLQDSLDLAFGARVDGTQGLSGVLLDWADQAHWLATMLAAGHDVLTESGGPFPGDVADQLGLIEALLNAAGNDLGQLGKWAQDLPSPTDWPLIQLPDWLPSWLPFADALRDNRGVFGVSPLVLDLDGDGVEVTKLGWGDAGSRVYFDMDNDGFAERTAWATGGDGFLALDRNGNGKIDAQNELFGNGGAFAHGFAALKALDTNNDNRITSADAQFANLRVWIDADVDGVSDAGELRTLGSLGITSIDLNATTLSGTLNNENAVSHRSTFTMGGQTRTVDDVWFRTDEIDTRWTGDYTLDIRTLFLPTLKGFGTLKDLHVAMSLDGGLLTLVQNFAGAWDTARFADYDAVLSDVRAILYKWAGVDGMAASDPRFPNTDAREIAFMDKLTGKTSPWIDTLSPGEILGWGQESQLSQAFTIALHKLAAALVLQSGGAEMFESASYNPATGETSAGSLVIPGIAERIAEANAQPNITERRDYWGGMATFLLTVKTEHDFSAQELAALNAAGTGLNIDSQWLNFARHTAPAEFFGRYTLNGTEASEVLEGGSGNDQLWGRGGDDALYGHGGDDQLIGGSQNDLIVGGIGNDVLSNSGGNDTYLYNTGDGHDLISESDGTDTIRFGSGITASAVSLERSGDWTYLRILVNGAPAIDIQQFFNAEYYRIERLEFADGSSIDLTVYLDVVGTEGDDVLNGLDRTLLRSDRIFGGSGKDTLDGGMGNDRLYGGLGDDRYVYASGTGKGLDMIRDDGGIDTISMGNAYTSANVTLTRVGQHDLAVFGAGVQRLLIEYQFAGPTYAIENLRLGDGTTINLLTYSHTVNGTAGDDFLYGTSFNAGPDRLNGLDGNDSIQAGDGDDIVTGGNGNDYLNGDGGNDTLSGNAGDDYVYGGAGNDTLVYESGADVFEGGQGTDVISLTNATFTTANMTLFRPLGNSYELQVRFSGTTAFTIRSQFTQDYGVETIRFANGATFNLTTVQYTTSGTSAGETLDGIGFGGNPNDIISGLGGGDIIQGYGGNDSITGGTGNDYLYGGDGDDTYIYNSGDGLDRISDQGGTDVISIGAGFVKSDLTWQRDGGTSNLLLFLKGTQVMNLQNHFYQNYQIETVRFADGSTQALTGLQITTNGTAGNDSLGGLMYNASINDIINGLGGDDYIYAYAGNDTLTGGTGNDSLQGGEGNDIYVYNTGDGLDTIQDSSGTDEIRIGAGFVKADLTWQRVNTHDLALSLKGVQVMTVQNHFTDGYAIETVRFADNSTTALTNFALTISGTSGNDSLSGFGITRDTLRGNAGDDTLYGYGGNDTLIGGTGRDYLQGGTGDDTYSFAVGDSSLSNPDYLHENVGEGVDTVRLTGGILPSAVTMWTDFYNLYIRYSATDTIQVVSGYDATGSLIGNYVERVALDNGTIWDLRGGLTLTATDDAQTLVGSALADTLDGRGGNDTIYAYAGNDTITGGAGDDYLNGGAGDDTYRWGAGSGADILTEESGNADRILIGSGWTSENVGFSIESTYQLRLTSALSSADRIEIQSQFYPDSPGSVVETLHFADGFQLSLATYNSWLRGTTSANTINGDAGGVTRNDTMLGGGGNDTLNGLNGDDVLSGEAGTDTLRGGAGNDNLHGGSGNDVLFGDAGNDVLWGGLGTDTLTGGTGADRFVFDTSTASSDTITDFKLTENDKLDLSDVLDFVSGTHAITDFVQITTSGTNSILRIDADGTANGVSFVQIATLQNVTGLTDEAALMASGHLLAA